MRRIEAMAAAKVNLSLVVRSARSDGLHPLLGRFQSIDWYDRIVVDPVGDPGIAGMDGRPVVDGEDNLAWLAASRAAVALAVEPVALGLDKQIAVAAGLAGGSADAAATLAATAYAAGAGVSTVASLAMPLGSDVPFCLVGGSADVSGVGDVVEPVDTVRDHAFAVVVPPVELATSTVFAAWDELGGPTGSEVATAALPPSLRHGPMLRNDLTAAAVAVAPEIAEWRSALETVWGRPVLLSGSGPSLYGLFLDVDEAGAALAVVPAGARDVRAVEPIDHGWAVAFDGASAHDDLRPDHGLGEKWHTVRPGVLASAFR